MLTSTLWIAALLMLDSAQAAALPTITVAPTPTVQHTSHIYINEAADGSEATAHPWYVKQASQQIVDFCFIGGMMGWGKHGHKGGNGGGAPPATYSDSGDGGVPVETTMDTTYVTNYETTLFTTIPGDVVTIYGPEDQPVTSTLADITYSSVFSATGAAIVYGGSASTPTAASSASFDGAALTVAPPAPTSQGIQQGFAGQVKHIENYAHALAEAIIAPHQMTKALAEVFEVGSPAHIKAPHALNLLSQVNEGMKALETDPAYSKQRQNLLAQPTAINYHKAVEKMTEKHENQINHLLAEPSGHQVYSMVKEIGQRFLSEYAPEQC